MTGRVLTFTGCLRNAQAVAEAVTQAGKRISIIPAGEKWGDNSLRPAIEDWVGAGAMISYLQGRRSPEAHMAELTFREIRSELVDHLQQCISSQELIRRGFADDVRLALAFNVSDATPVLFEDAYQCSDPSMFA